MSNMKFNFRNQFSDECNFFQELYEIKCAGTSFRCFKANWVREIKIATSDGTLCCQANINDVLKYD